VDVDDLLMVSFFHTDLCTQRAFAARKFSPESAIEALVRVRKQAIRSVQT